jgi:hypothetical protein
MDILWFESKPTTVYRLGWTNFHGRRDVGLHTRKTARFASRSVRAVAIERSAAVAWLGLHAVIAASSPGRTIPPGLRLRRHHEPKTISGVSRRRR